VNAEGRAILSKVYTQRNDGVLERGGLHPHLESRSKALPNFGRQSLIHRPIPCAVGRGTEPHRLLKVATQCALIAEAHVVSNGGDAMLRVRRSHHRRPDPHLT